MEKSKILVIIPARSGSKGFPNKNFSNFNGEPLVIRTINQALRIFNSKQIFVSTDSEDYKKIIESKTDILIPQLRPEFISGDYSTNDEYIEHAIKIFNEMEELYTHILVLQPTSPLRMDIDIESSINMQLSDSDLVASVFETKSNPYYLHLIKDNNGKLISLFENKFTRRQDAPKVFELNGAIFYFTIKGFENNNKSMKFRSIIPFEMEWRKSIDIDEELDLKIAELLYQYI